MRWIVAALVAAVLIFGPVIMSPAAPFYACTRVIGYSNTKQWFTAGPFEAQVGTERWELLAVGGKGQIQFWADPAFFGWNSAVISPCTSPVDRVLIDVGALQKSQLTKQHVLAAANNARAKYGITVVLLQPIAGGPNHSICPDVRASMNHGAAHAAIDQAVAAAPQNVWGYDLLVKSCADFSEGIGHFTAAGAWEVSTRLGSYYAAR